MRCKGAPEVNLLRRTCGRMKALSKQALLWNVPRLWLLIPAHRTHTKQGQQMAKTLRSWSTRRLINRSCCWGGKGRSRIRRQPPLQRAQQTKSRNKQTNKPQGFSNVLSQRKRGERRKISTTSAETQQAEGSLPAFPTAALPTPNCSRRAPKETPQQLPLQP